MGHKETICTEEDFQQLLACLFDAAWNPQEWPTFLDRLGRILNSVCTTLYYQDANSQKGSLAVSIDMVEKDQHFYKAFSHQKTHKHNVFAEDARLSGYVLRSGEVVVATDFYEDWLLGALILRQDSIKANLVCLRPSSSGAFTMPERKLLERLVPYLKRAVLLHRRLRGMKLMQDAISQLINQLTMGVVLTDCKGKVLSNNRKAREMLDRNDGFSLAEGFLRAFRSDEMKQMYQMLKAIAPCENHPEKPAVHAMRVSRKSDREPFSILASALTTDLQVAEGECIVALFIQEPDEELHTPERILREFYGLTPAETRLVSQLLKGKTLEEITMILQISMSTARTQLRSVFTKTNTNRQADLIRLILRSPINTTEIN